MSDILIKGMEMPQTGLYFVSVDNTNGRDKTVVAVERMIGNRDVRQIVGLFELIPVPPHGRLIDADAICADIDEKRPGRSYEDAWALTVIDAAPTIIPASEEGGCGRCDHCRIPQTGTCRYGEEGE